MTAAWRENRAATWSCASTPAPRRAAFGFNPLDEDPPRHHPRGGRRAEPRHHPRRPRGQGAGGPLGEDHPRLPHRRDAACALQARRPQAGGAYPMWPRALSDPAQPVESLYKEMLPTNGGRAEPARHHRRVGARHDQPARRGARLGAVDRHVVPVALPRSAGGEERVAQRLLASPT